jgi:nucleoside-diphosphate-sugar epimerase
MSNNGELHVVFGASGGTGNAVVRELVAQSKRVRAVNRSGRADVPAGVQTVKGDATDLASTREACWGASVVYHCVNVPYGEWHRQLMPMMNHLIDAAATTEAKLVYADNLYAYGKPTGALREDMPYHPVGRKGELRAQVANTLMQAHQGGTVRAAIGRASDFFGPRATSIAGNVVWRPLLTGKKAMWIGNLDMPHTLSFLPDVARGLMTLGEREEALGQVWHIPTDVPLTGRQYLQMINEEAGSKPNFGVYTRPVLRIVALFSPMVREVLEELYQFEAPFVMDSSKFTRAFGGNFTPHRDAIKQTVIWYRQHGAGHL